MKYWEKGASRIARLLHLDIAHSQKHYARTLNSLVAPGDRWLDIGCGRQILPPWAMHPDEQSALAARASCLIGMDFDPSILEHPLLQERVIGNGECLPFDGQTFDLLTANMVVEHLANPEQVLREVKRVLKPGGRLLFHTPNYNYYLVRLAALTPDFLKRRIVWYLEGRHDQDIFPTHYRMNTMGRIHEVAGAAGLEVESIRTSVSAGEFYALGPLNWLECFWLKFLSVIGRGKLDQSLIVVLRRLAAAEAAAEPAGRPLTPGEPLVA